MYIHVETQPKLFLYCVARINSLIHVAYICSFLTIHLPVSFPLFFFISNLLQNQFKLIFNSINSDVKYTTLPLKKKPKKQTKTKLTQCHLKRWSKDCVKNSSDRKTFFAIYSSYKYSKHYKTKCRPVILLSYSV